MVPLEDNSAAYGRGRRCVMKFYYKMLEKWSIARESFYLNLAFIIASGILYVYADAAENKLLQRFIVYLLVINSALALLGPRALLANIIRRYLLLMLSFPLAWRFRREIKEYSPEVRNYSWPLRHIVGGLLLDFPKEMRPEMISEAEMKIGYFHLGRLALEAKDLNNKPRFWKLYRTFHILGKVGALPPEKISFPYLYEIGYAFSIGEDSLIRFLEKKPVQDYREVMYSLKEIIDEQGRDLRNDFMKNLAIEQQFSVSRCLDNYKMSSYFPAFYSRANNYNRKIKALMKIKVFPIDCFEGKIDPFRMSEVCEYLKQKSLELKK